MDAVLVKPTKTVMIVENDQEMSLLLSQLFSDEGYTVVAASDGHEALTKLKSDTLPNLIFTDMTMPGMGGEELATQIRVDPRTKDIPMVLSTGHSDIKERARKMGVQGYLLKPYSIAAILAMVNRFL